MYTPVKQMKNIWPTNTIEKEIEHMCLRNKSSGHFGQETKQQFIYWLILVKHEHY